MQKFSDSNVKKHGQATVFKGLCLTTVIIVIIVLYCRGARKHLKLLERSANTELWYTANSNLSTYYNLSGLNICKYCTNASNLCNSLDHTVVVYFVSSYPQNAERRHAIRDTWGASPYKPIFVMGISLDTSEMDAVLNEAHKYNDIIIENFIDTFENSTLKTAGVLKHFNEFCPNTRYLMKTQDDVFVNTKLVDDIARKHIGSAESNLPIIGYVLEGIKVKRNPRSIWYIGRSMYAEQKYPAYTSGSGYMLPGESVQKILTKSTDIQMIPIEDVFFTGMIASRVGIVRKMEISFMPGSLTVINHCALRSRAIVSDQNPSRFYNLWKALKENHPEACSNWYNIVLKDLFG